MILELPQVLRMTNIDIKKRDTKNDNQKTESIHERELLAKKHQAKNRDEQGTQITQRTDNGERQRLHSDCRREQGDAQSSSEDDKEHPVLKKGLMLKRNTAQPRDDRE